MSNVVSGQHLPDCPSQHPAGVEVTSDALVLTVTACTGCLPLECHMEREFAKIREAMAMSADDVRRTMERIKAAFDLP